KGEPLPRDRSCSIARLPDLWCAVSPALREWKQMSEEVLERTVARKLTDIRVIGPTLMIVFGLVLLITPPASVGANGAVGTAGVQLKLEPPSDDPLPQDPGTGPTIPPSTNPPASAPSSVPTTTEPVEEEGDEVEAVE